MVKILRGPRGWFLRFVASGGDNVESAMMLCTIRLSDEQTRRELDRLHDKGELVLVEDGECEVTAMPMGTDTGQPAVGFRFKLPDGRTVFAMTSMRLFVIAAEAFRGRYGERLGKIR